MRHTEAKFSPQRKPICLEGPAATELPALKYLLSHTTVHLHAALHSLGLNQPATNPSCMPYPAAPLVVPQSRGNHHHHVHFGLADLAKARRPATVQQCSNSICPKGGNTTLLPPNSCFFCPPEQQTHSRTGNQANWATVIAGVSHPFLPLHTTPTVPQ